MRLPRRSACVFIGMAVLALAGACRRAAVPPGDREALAAAVSTTLPFSARLSGGFAPSKQGPTRAAGDRPELTPDTRIAIALLEKRAIETPTPAALSDLGVAYLIQGDVDRAIATIEDAASQQTAAAPWSDLSAAYLAKAERTPARKIEYLARALEAAERSLKIARTNDALFNRALARDGLAPFTGAPAGWAEYAATETNQAWRDAAAQRAGDDRAVDDVRDRWESRRKELFAKLMTGDASFAKETARLYPEASMEFFERQLLTDHNSVASAGLLADAIHRVTNDVMTRDEVALLRSRGAAVAAAHRIYAKGASLYEVNDLVGARALLQRASVAFVALDAPYRSWAQVRLAEIDWREGALDLALRKLDPVIKDARRHGYRTLLGRALWQQGLVYNRQWRLSEGLSAFRESASQFEASSLREYATSLYSLLADALRMLGETHDSWSYIGRTLEDLSYVRGPVSRYLLLYNASLFASRQDLYEAALLFQDATVRQATEANTDVHTEALVQRALINVRRGDDAKARIDLERAMLQAASSSSDAFRAYITAELGIVRAQLTGNQRAVPDLQDAIGFFEKTEPGRVPGLYLMLARTLPARALPATAEKALQSGIDRLEAQQAGVGDDALRISFFDESWGLFRDMVSLQLRANDPGKAFEYAERSRARTLLATMQGASLSTVTSLPGIQAQLPPSVVVVHYSVLADRVLIWTIARSGTALVERTIGERELARLIDRHRESIRTRTVDRASDRLHSLLVAPAMPALAAASTVVMIPDGALQQLPFATLRHPSTLRYLIEDYALMVSPSASFFVDAASAAAQRSTGPIRSALLVGNPSTGTTKALPGAEAEVEAAAHMYQRREVLIGRSATRDRFVALAPGFDVVHFGGHALANPEYPLLSRLVFADHEGVEQSLFAHEIARLRFRSTRVVVLAACSTAAGAVSRGEGVVSVARPFLGSGVPLVIASQWDVDDQATGQLMLAFHRELASSQDPVRALRTAQLALLRSGDATQALPVNWGAFVAVGTTVDRAVR